MAPNHPSSHPPALAALVTGLASTCAGGLIAASFALAPSPAAAHGIQSSLERLASLRAGLDRPGYELQTSFSNGQPAPDAEVRLVPPEGGEGLSLGYTDAGGRLRFRLPRQAPAGWELQVDAGPGHRDYLELPGSAPAGAAAAGPSAAVSAGLLVVGLVAAQGRRRI